MRKKIKILCLSVSLKSNDNNNSRIRTKNMNEFKKMDNRIPLLNVFIFLMFLKALI